jgi:hypothetical protein
MSSATDPAQAILAMVNWLGLIVMPVMAALFLAIGVYRYSKGESMERSVIGVMVAISISGITRLAALLRSPAVREARVDQIRNTAPP